MLFFFIPDPDDKSSGMKLSVRGPSCPKAARLLLYSISQLLPAITVNTPPPPLLHYIYQLSYKTLKTYDGGPLAAGLPPGAERRREGGFQLSNGASVHRDGRHEKDARFGEKWESFDFPS